MKRHNIDNWLLPTELITIIASFFALIILLALKLSGIANIRLGLIAAVLWVPQIIIAVAAYIYCQIFEDK